MLQFKFYIVKTDFSFAMLQFKFYIVKNRFFFCYVTIEILHC